MLAITHRRRSTFAWLVAALAIGAGMQACGEEAPDSIILPTSTSGSGGAGGSAPKVDQGFAKFSEVEAELVKECAGCHKVGGQADTPFLGDPETKNPSPYEAITSWPGILVVDWKKSDLVTWPASGVHSGPAPSSALADGIEAWLKIESESIAETTEESDPTLAPRKPIMGGFNSFYLDSLGQEFSGMAITFFAEELSDSTLKLSKLEVHPTLKNGIDIDHPLFVVYPKGSTAPEPDPVDSFSNVAQSVEVGTSAPLGPGLVILSNWSKGAKISIAFKSIAATDPNGGMGGAGGAGGNDGPCMALSAFTNNAAPALAPCMLCHGGGNGTATNAVDMTQLQSNPTAACGQLYNRIDPNNPQQSQLFVTTNPNVANGHPFKFGGNSNNFNTFVTAVTTWIQAEN